LTERERCRTCQKLLDKGRDIILLHGIKKVSVDDITKAAGMAKGSFYQYFGSKEKFLFEMIMDTHKQVFAQAERMLMGGNDMRETLRTLLLNLFNIPEMVFLTKHYNEINELVESMTDQEAQLTNQMEVSMFRRLMTMLGIDTKKVSPGVVHNYLHTLYLIMGSELMSKEDLPQTAELIRESLISYIFGGDTQ